MRRGVVCLYCYKKLLWVEESKRDYENSKFCGLEWGS